MLENLEKMVTTFLESMFQVSYEGIHNGERNCYTTVMLAYDDAVHGVTGKAGENRIFDIDFNEEPFRNVFSMGNKIFMEVNGHESMADRVRYLAEKLGYSIQWMDKAEEGCTVISLCDTIFELEDLTRQKVYIDINDCIMATEEDILDVINYNYSKRSFVMAQKPVFLQKIKELRQSL